jgi:hypothetical protein
MRTSLSLPDTLRLFEVASDQRARDAAQAFQAASTEQGLPITAAFAQTVVTQAAVVPLAAITPWKRPRSNDDWRAQQAQADAHRQKIQQLVERARFEGFGLGFAQFVLGCVLGGYSAWNHDEFWSGSVGCLMACSAVLSGIFFAAFREVMLLRHEPGENPIAQAIAERKGLTPIALTHQEALDYGEVPGLGRCIAAILDSDVPFLRLDRAHAEAALMAFHAQSEQQEKARAQERQRAEQEKHELRQALRQA